MPDRNRSVFVVHGRNLKARDAMFEFLEALDLHSIEWSEAVQATGKPTPYIGEILDAAFEMAKAVVVLFTPDDDVRLRSEWHKDGDPPHETSVSGQARPNVLFEAGFAMGRHEKRTVLVEVGKLRPFSDIAGRHVVRADGSKSWRNDLATRLRTAGCAVKLEGNWLSAGDFASALSASRSPDLGSPEADTPAPVASEATPDLSPGAAEMLRLANDDTSKRIEHWTGSGEQAVSAGRSRLDVRHPRAFALVHDAIEGLVGARMICIRRKNEYSTHYSITHRGFEWIDTNGGSPTQSVFPPAISRHAEELLRAAVGGDGRVIRFSSARRVNIKVKGRAFDTSDAQSFAKWEGALRELENLDLVQEESDTVFSVTRGGFDWVNREKS